MAFGFFRMPVHFVVPAHKKKTKTKTKYLQMTKSQALRKQAIIVFCFLD